MGHLLRFVLILPIFLFLISPGDLRAQECDSVKITDFPKTDLPADFSKTILKSPGSYKYYYGIGVPVDYVKARQLAFIEMKKNENEEYSGEAILMMLYANGYGVKRNLDLAIRLACEYGGAPAEIEGRKQHLNAMKSDDPVEIFDICDDITSGRMMGICQEIQSELYAVSRKSQTDSIIKGWPEKDKIAYKNLRQAATVFFDKRVHLEVDLTGTARSMFESEEEDSLEYSFLMDVMRIDHCSVNYSYEDFKNADSAMNRIYAKIKDNTMAIYGTVTKDGVRETQRKWIQYRDAWSLFGSIRCPHVTASSWKTLITKERIVQLQDLVENQY